MNYEFLNAYDGDFFILTVTSTVSLSYVWIKFDYKDPTFEGLEQQVFY